MGWLINVTTEKNKNSSSKHEISLVFDKRGALNKFWSEFLFLSTYCPSEVKLQRGGVEPFIPLCVKTEGAYSKLEVINPLTGEIEYTSKSFYKKNAKKLYEEDEEFRKWFDIAVDYSCKERISKGLLKIDMKKYDGEQVIMDSISEDEGEVISTAEIPKKRGRKKKEETLAPSTQDQEIDESLIIEE